MHLEYRLYTEMPSQDLRDACTKIVAKEFSLRQEKLLQYGNGFFYDAIMATENNRLVGFILIYDFIGMEFYDGLLRASATYVCPKDRRKGVARSMWKNLAEWSRANNYPGIESEQMNEKMVKLFKNHLDAIFPKDSDIAWISEEKQRIRVYFF